MPTGYVKKLAKQHGVSTATAENHWTRAKAAANKEGHGEDFGYVTAIFKKMMHENAFVPSLKDLTNGMTFKYFLVAEADAEAPKKERSPEYKHLERFPQFGELPFKARVELEREAKELLDGYEALDQEEKDSVDDYLHDLVIDKMQDVVGRGAMVGDWKGEEEFQKRQQYAKDVEAALSDEPGPAAPVEKPKRFSAGPRHIAAMRQKQIPTDRAADAPAGSDEVGAPVKSYYKPWSALNDEQRAGRAALAKKHGTIHRVKNSRWFLAMPEDKQHAILSVLRAGGSLEDAKKAAGG